MQTREVLVESRSNSLGIEIRIEYRSVLKTVLCAYQLGEAVAERAIVRADGWRRGPIEMLQRGLKSVTKEALTEALDEGLRVLRDTREAA